MDIKPYIPGADAFPNARAGWVDEQSLDGWDVSATEEFIGQSAWLDSASGLDALNFARCQLSVNPLDTTRRRVRVEASSRTAELAFRTFRIDFSFDKNARKILLKGIRSGYSVQELETPEDRYGDKPLHREFLLHFAQSPKA